MHILVVIGQTTFVTHDMNYDTYYKLCCEQYNTDINTNFYQKPVQVYESDFFGLEYINIVNSLAKKVKTDFDYDNDCDCDGLFTKQVNIWKYSDDIDSLCNIIVPYLEANKYGCHLYVDKIYIYRTNKIKTRQSSYEWHYDNNPDEIVKNLIYLNNVNEQNSPYEFLRNNDKQGVLGNCTRRGTETWYPAPNNSRVGHLIDNLIKTGYTTKRVVGPKGTMVSFINNSIHRANPIIDGYRDVINIRVKPCLHKAPKYVSPQYTTSYEFSGVVNKDPTLAWNSKI